MSKYTIFYADDDLDDLEFFREIIENLDADVNLVTQQNGQEVLHALNNPPPNPHLLFLDINMPGMTGFDVLQKVRESQNHQNALKHGQKTLKVPLGGRYLLYF